MYLEEKMRDISGDSSPSRLLRSCNYVVARTCPVECRSRDEIQNRGKQKVALENPYKPRYPIGRCIYGAIPTLRRCRSTPTIKPPMDRSVYHRFRIYPGIPPSSPASSFRWHVIRRFAATVANASRTETSFIRYITYKSQLYLYITLHRVN